MSNELAVVQQQVEVVAQSSFSVRFTPEQRKLILDTCCGGATEKEAAALIAIAEARGLNPLAGDCYFVNRAGKWAVQASIDSFRMKAEQTGEYQGQDEPEFEYKADGSIKLARVRIYRKGWPRPSIGVADWDEYAQTSSPTWKRMPKVMISKCAEAIAFRKGFPAVFSKVYTQEEMDQADAAPSVAKPLAPPPVNNDESEKLCQQIADLMRASTNDADLAAAIQEASKAKPRLSKEHQKTLAKVMRETQEALLKKPEVVDAQVVA